MLLAYVDESYDKNFYWITALVCPEDTLIPLTGALDDAYWKGGGYPTPATVELHGHDLFHGKRDFEPLIGQPRRRIKWYTDAFAAIASQPTIRIFIRGIDRKRQIDRYGANAYHPHDVVLPHLLERIDSYAEHVGQRVMVIADELQDAKHHRASLRQYQRSGTYGYRARVLTQVVDTMHFSPSSASRLLQAADLVSFLHHRIHSGVEADPRAQRANAKLWARIQPQVYHCDWWAP